MKPFSIPNKLYFRIGEVADLLHVKPYVLRYWETEFPDIRPAKSKSGQRLYKRRDVDLLVQIKDLLYHENFTINGARKRLKEMMREHRLQEPPVAYATHAAQIPLYETRETTPAISPGSPAKDFSKVFGKIKKDLQSVLEDLKK